MTTPPVRLPCRGCTRDCKNYLSCNGLPWRSLKPQTQPGQTNACIPSEADTDLEQKKLTGC